MTRQDCGCFDGPFSELTKMLVSVRCTEHADKPPKPGHSLILRDKKGKLEFPPRRKRDINYDP